MCSLKSIPSWQYLTNNAEMMHRHIELLVAPVHLKARHEEYVLKLNKAAELLMSK